MNSRENHLFDDSPLPRMHRRLIRQLSAEYVDPITGELTANDPSSYSGEEREMREDALLRDLPDTACADSIRSQRRHTERNHVFFWKPGCCNDTFFNKFNKDDTPDPDGAAIPVIGITG